MFCFPQNGNIDNPYCNGMEGILEAYHQSLKTVQLYGPTNFAPVVNHVARYKHSVPVNISENNHRSFENQSVDKAHDAPSEVIRQ